MIAMASTCVSCAGSGLLLRDTVCPLCDGDPGWPEVVWKEFSVQEGDSRLQPPHYGDFVETVVSAKDPSYRLERVHCNDLTVEEFRQRYVCGTNPVIIEGLQPYMDPEGKCSLDFLEKELDGELDVDVKGRGVMRLSEFFESMRSSQLSRKQSGIRLGNSSFHANNETSLYMADVSVASNFPWLFSEFVKVPKYFLHCFAHRTRDLSLQRLNYILPALFVGGAGSFSSLHIDQYSSNFWMYMAEGAKLWTVFHEGDFAKVHSSARYFDEEYQNWRWSSALLGSGDACTDARRLDFVLRAGEVLFIPERSPHEVYNLTQSVSISSNFWDQSNLQDCLPQLQAKVRWLDSQVQALSALRGSAEVDVAVERLEAMARRWESIHASLDEIDFPDLEDDLQYADRLLQPDRDDEEFQINSAAPKRSDFVGLFPLHRPLQHNRSTLRRLPDKQG